MEQNRAFQPADQLMLDFTQQVSSTLNKTFDKESEMSNYINQMGYSKISNLEKLQHEKLSLAPKVVGLTKTNKNKSMTQQSLDSAKS